MLFHIDIILLLAYTRSTIFDCFWLESEEDSKIRGKAIKGFMTGSDQLSDQENGKIETIVRISPRIFSSPTCDSLCIAESQ